MDAVRHRLRFAVVVWLLAQAASLSAFVPTDCCAEHSPMPAEAVASCHRQPEVAKVAECPMPAADGTPCPMHRGTSHTPPANECRMTAVCDGPAAALLGVLSYHGVLPAPSAMQPDPAVVTALLAGAVRVRPLFTRPDSPPPRA